VQLQVSEGTAVRKLEESRKKVSKLEAMVLRLEQKIDDKDNNLFHKQKEANNKVQYLKRNLHVSTTGSYVSLEMTSVAPTNARRHVKLNVASAHS